MEITNINSEGLTYIDEAGNPVFINFETCHQNRVMAAKKSSGANWTSQKEAFWQRTKYVGVRYALSDPPAVQFYTVPLTKFEFPTREALYEVLYEIKKAGWRTNDGE